MFYLTEAVLVDWCIYFRPEHPIMTALSKRLLEQNAQFRQTMTQCVKAAHEGRDLAGKGVKLATGLSGSSDTVKGFKLAVLSMTDVARVAYNDAVSMSTQFQNIRSNILQVCLLDLLRRDGFITISQKIFREIPAMIVAIEEELSHRTDDIKDIGSLLL
jgi:hypothetical protein